MPMLAPIAALTTSSTNGSLRLAVSRWATSAAASRSASSSTTANSSPPSLTTRSDVASDSGRRGPSWSEQLIAGRVTEGVVDLLEVVEVDEQEGQLPSPGAPGRSRRPSTWKRCRRLPRPVSSSVTDRRRSSAAHPQPLDRDRQPGPHHDRVASARPIATGSTRRTPARNRITDRRRRPARAGRSRGASGWPAGWSVRG